MKSFLSKKIMQSTLLLIGFVFALPTFAGIQTNGFDFEKQITEGAQTVYADIIPGLMKDMDPMSDGSYIFKAQLGFLGKDSEDFASVHDAKITVRAKDSKNTLVTLGDVGSTSIMIGNSELHLIVFESINNYPPENYTIEFLWNNQVIETTKLCLPTFTTNGKSIGNVTCTNTPPPTPPVNNPSGETTPPAPSGENQPVNNPGNPSGGAGTPSGGGGSSYPIGGLTASFPPEGQVITETEAVISGTITASFSLPVNLSYAWGKKGETLSNPEVLIVDQLKPGEQIDFTIPFQNLTPGTAYSFIFKNGGNASPVISFTTPGGAGNANPVFMGQTLGTNENAGLITGVEDTISDKGIVPRCGRTPGTGVKEEETRMCGYQDFLQLIANVIDYLLIILGPIVAAIAMYVGAMIIWLGKIPDPSSAQMAKLREMKAFGVRVLIGLFIILSSWLIVATVVRELGVKDEYILIDIFSK